jgi:hypothetical protein
MMDHSYGFNILDVHILVYAIGQSYKWLRLVIVRSNIR